MMARVGCWANPPTPVHPVSTAGVDDTCPSTHRTANHHCIRESIERLFRLWSDIYTNDFTPYSTRPHRHLTPATCSHQWRESELYNAELCAAASAPAKSGSCSTSRCPAVGQSGSYSGNGTSGTQPQARHSLGETLRDDLNKVHLPHVQMPQIQRPHIPPQFLPNASTPARKYQPPYILIGAVLVGLVLVAILWLAVDNLVPRPPISTFFRARWAGNQTPVPPPGVKHPPLSRVKTSKICCQRATNTPSRANLKLPWSGTRRRRNNRRTKRTFTGIGRARAGVNRTHRRSGRAGRKSHAARPNFRKCSC